MTGKSWLNRARGLDREINDLLREKERTRDALLRITQSYTRSEAQTTPDPHKFDRLAEYEDLIDRKVDDLLAVKQEILDTVSKLENRAQRRALIGYYVSFKTWEQVAVGMHYSFQHVMRIRNEAIAEVEKLINAEKM